MILTAWAARWGIPAQAVAELVNMSTPLPQPPTRPVTSESALQSLVRLEAAAKGVWLTRNNVGALLDATGRSVRYGLANESPKENAEIKSADLIGVRKVLITDRHVGTVLGQIVSRECKPPGWRYTGTKREQAQLRWATFINSMGGDAAIVSGEGSL